MPLVPRRVVVPWGDRRFICRPPTGSTVLALLEHLGEFAASVNLTIALVGGRVDTGAIREELGDVVAQQIKRIATLIRTDQLADPDTWVELSLAESGLPAVLATCVELHDGAPGELETMLSLEGLEHDAVRERRPLLGSLVRACLGLCDVRRIARSIPLPLPGDPAPDTCDVDPAVPFLMVAERFGVAPTSVLEWPYEVFLSAKDYVRTREEIEHKRAAAGASVQTSAPGSSPRRGGRRFVSETKSLDLFASDAELARQGFNVEFADDTPEA